MRDGKSLSGADGFNDYFGLMVSLDLCQMEKILTTTVSQEEPADGVARRDA
jgi:hypothetical protein